MTVKTRILIVDDDRDFAGSNKDLLEPFGYEVQTAGDGRSGVLAAKQFVPDLMILDVMMSTDTEGFDVARRIRELAELRKTKVLLLTGIKDSLNLPEELEPDDTWLPVHKVLEKPIAPGRLIKEVEKALREKKV
jgi:CheY-like chemotaxis protein